MYFWIKPQNILWGSWPVLVLPDLGAFVRAAALANLFPRKFFYFEQTKISYKIHPVQLK